MLIIIIIIITNPKKKICTLDMIRVKKRYNTDYGTLLICCPWSYRICCCINANCCHELLETKVYISYAVCRHSNDYPDARAYPPLENKQYSSGKILFKIIQQKMTIITIEVKTAAVYKI